MRGLYSKISLFGIVALGGILFGNSSSWAFQYGTVILDKAPLRENPTASAKILARLPKGARVTAQDTPTAGYYKVRAALGTGWIAANAMHMDKAAAQGALDEGGAKNPEVPERPYTKFTIRGYFGLSLYSISDIQNQLGTTALNGGTLLGGEIQFNFKPRWAVAVRVDHISKTVLANDSNTQASYEFDVTSTPIFIGLDFAAVNTPHFQLHLGLFVGMGSIDFKTTTTALNSGATPSGGLITDYNESAIPIQGRLDLDWNIWRHFGIFASGGYQLMSGTSAQPGTLASAPFSTLFQSNGNTISIGLNLSGLEASGGLKFMF